MLLIPSTEVGEKILPSISHYLRAYIRNITGQTAPPSDRPEGFLSLTPAHQRAIHTEWGSQWEEHLSYSINAMNTPFSNTSEGRHMGTIFYQRQKTLFVILFDKFIVVWGTLRKLSELLPIASATLMGLVEDQCNEPLPGIRARGVTLYRQSLAPQSPLLMRRLTISATSPTIKSYATDSPFGLLWNRHLARCLFYFYFYF